MDKNDKGLDFDLTIIVVCVAIIYGFVSLIYESLSFDTSFVFYSILFVFSLESVIHIINLIVFLLKK